MMIAAAIPKIYSQTTWHHCI